MANSNLITSVQAQGVFSFSPDSAPLALRSLNVLIGPNGAGKSNLIEIFELLRAAPIDLLQAIREAGGVDDILWKGKSVLRSASIKIDYRYYAQDTDFVAHSKHVERPYYLAFSSENGYPQIIHEVIGPYPDNFPQVSPGVSYAFQFGSPVIFNQQIGNHALIGKESFRVDQSILSQRKDPTSFPELYWLSDHVFGRIQTFREWTFGRGTAVRRAQATDLPTDYLLPHGANLALVLAEILHKDDAQFNELMRRFLPRFKRLTTRVVAGAMTYYLHEGGLSEPISSYRMSDGTLRFLALLAVLLAPTPPSLLCIEEPELGLHPDAVALMAELLVEVSQRTQLVVTTHSDTLVSALSAHVDSVVVCENLGAGTVMERLDADRLKVWLDKYKLGEIWRMGELGGNP